MAPFRVDRIPDKALVFTNRASVNPDDHASTLHNASHVQLMAPGGALVFALVPHKATKSGTLGFSEVQRKWAMLSVNADVDIRPRVFDEQRELASTVVVVVDFYSSKKTAKEPFDTDQMADEFRAQFMKQAVCVGQPMAFQFKERPLLIATISKVETAEVSADRNRDDVNIKTKAADVALIFGNTSVLFEKGDQSAIYLTGKSRSGVSAQPRSIINPDWDFGKMGIGGLDKEFNAIFRRAFASRVFPPEVMDQLGCKHVKGVLLFGPPGTGKTLMARQIGQMLNAREPKIVNGPEILDKYVGESEANIRKLFAEAEEEERRLGPHSGLHIIIFDEIDAICKARGSVAGNSGVNDTVVNQLLSKIDGVDQLNNILVIGMTNRRDMIDDALLRPGRLEVSVEIGLPKENGRLQILDIHTRKMRANKKLGDDVDLKELAAQTKNFSGAEIEGLVRAAQSCALNRLVKAESKVEIASDAAEKLKVTKADFTHALENDVKPAFGAADETLQTFIGKGIITWGEPLKAVVEDAQLLIRHAASSQGTGLVSILLEGAHNAGKTALAAQLARSSGFPFVKICSPEDMVGFTEAAKCMQIRKIFDDAYRSSLSCVLVDNVERLLDYGPIGPRYSNLTLQALLVLLKKVPPKGRRLLVICTTSQREILQHMELTDAFTDVLHVPNLTMPEHFRPVLEAYKNILGSDREVQTVMKELNKPGRHVSIGIKKLLDLLDMIGQMGAEHRADKLVDKMVEARYLSE